MVWTTEGNARPSRSRDEPRTDKGRNDRPSREAATELSLRREGATTTRTHEDLSVRPGSAGAGERTVFMYSLFLGDIRCLSILLTRATRRWSPGTISR